MIFSTVDALVETVGRARAEVFGELDTLTAIWTGPTSLADTAPKIGATHPEYPNMELRARHKIADVANITKIQLDYVGLFSSGNIGTVARGFSTQVGELEYQQPANTRTGANVVQGGTLGPTGGPATVPGAVSFIAYGWKWWLQSVIATYISRSSTYRYCAKNATAPRFSGGTILSMVTRNGAQTNVLYGFLGPSISGPSIDMLYPGAVFGYHEEIFCSSFTAEPISPSWFRCSEVWSARLVAGP